MPPRRLSHLHEGGQEARRTRGQTPLSTDGRGRAGLSRERNNRARHKAQEVRVCGRGAHPSRPRQPRGLPSAGRGGGERSDHQSAGLPGLRQPRGAQSEPSELLGSSERLLVARNRIVHVAVRPLSVSSSDHNAHVRQGMPFISPLFVIKLGVHRRSPSPPLPGPSIRTASAIFICIPEKV